MTDQRALAYQQSMQESRADVDYFVFVPNRTRGEMPNVYEFMLVNNNVMKTAFHLLRERALDSPYCVWRMYYMMVKSINRMDATSSANLTDTIFHNQLFAEFGVDPAKAKEAPQHGEITEQDLATIQQGLPSGQREARLLQSQPPPNEALKKQNGFLRLMPLMEQEQDDTSLYMIFGAVTGFSIRSTKPVHIETFRMLRKRASISPRCLGVMCAFIETYFDVLKNPPYVAHLKELLRKQLQAEHGVDPNSDVCYPDNPASANDICKEVAQYATYTIL